MYSDRTDLLAAVDRRLWRDLGFTDPEPDIIPFLPSLVVAWSDGKLGAAEGEALRERAADLSDHLKAWLEERLRHPPGPYFRCQVSHLLAFLATVWPPGEGEEEDWKKEAEEWAAELIQEAGWLRRIFGGVTVERKNLQDLQKVMEDGGILASDRIWALARGSHAQAEPQRVSALVEDHDQAYQITGILLEGEEERIAVGCYTSVVRDDDLPEAKVAEKLRQSGHLHEPERWVLLKELVNGRGRPISDRLRAELKAKLETVARGTFEECTLPEMYYLEDALAADARWMSWIPGNIEELHIDRGEVRRQQAPGTFCGVRSKVQTSVEQQLVPGPEGLGFRVLSIRTEGRELRLAAPALLREPATPEAVAWIARFLPEMCDPHTQLVLDEQSRRWVAEVHSHIPTRCAAPEPLPPGRALLVPPWIWFRAANALGQRFFAGRRKVAK